MAPLVASYNESAFLPTTDQIDFVYQNTRTGARLRTLLVDLTIWYMSPQRADLDSRPAALVSACFLTFVEMVTMHDSACLADEAEDEAPFYGDICKAYHGHADGEMVTCSDRVREENDD